MRAATVLVGFLLLSGSAYAADAQMKQPAQDATGKVVLAAVDMKQIPAAPARPAKVSITERVSKIYAGDSRLNDYRLERESCCGPQ
ncbi:MAG: hypothetical protein WBM28_13345 [Burkholderiales bacterium]